MSVNSSAWKMVQESLTWSEISQIPKHECSLFHLMPKIFACNCARPVVCLWTWYTLLFRWWNSASEWRYSSGTHTPTGHPDLQGTLGCQLKEVQDVTIPFSFKNACRCGSVWCHLDDHVSGSQTYQPSLVMRFKGTAWSIFCDLIMVPFVHPLQDTRGLIHRQKYTRKNHCSQLKTVH